MDLKFSLNSFFVRYDILNLQDNANDPEHSLHYVQIGTWNTGKLSLNTSSMRFFADQRSLNQINIRRFCSDACPVGHIKVRFHFYVSDFFVHSFQKYTDEERCCWKCHSCGNAIVLDETTCFPCPTGFSPNTDQTGE